MRKTKNEEQIEHKRDGMLDVADIDVAAVDELAEIAVDMGQVAAVAVAACVAALTVVVIEKE